MTSTENLDQFGAGSMTALSSTQLMNIMKQSQLILMSRREAEIVGKPYCILCKKCNQYEHTDDPRQMYCWGCAIYVLFSKCDCGTKYKKLYSGVEQCDNCSAAGKRLPIVHGVGTMQIQ